MKHELVGKETLSKVRDAFTYLFADTFPDKQILARRFNKLRKNAVKGLKVSISFSLKHFCEVHYLSNTISDIASHVFTPNGNLTQTEQW